MKKLQMFITAFAAMVIAGTGTTIAQQRGYRQIFLQNWQFSKDGSSWQKVLIPHSYNAIDGHSPQYYRGKATYRSTIDISKEDTNRPLFLLFEGAAQQATVSVNGRQLTHHMGGYTPFVVPIRYAIKEGQNTVSVDCDNHEDVDLIPVSSDFNKNGGLHNPVYLLKMNPVYLSPEEYGLYRLHVSTPEVSRSMAKAHVETMLSNESGKKQKLRITIRLKDAAGNVKASDEQKQTMPAGTRRVVSSDLGLNNPHLWDGLDDPYLYSVEISVTDKQGREMDHASTKVGFRFYKMTRNDGFFLNGHTYPLRGMAEHQDTEGKASALWKQDYDRDYKMIKDLGCNFLRLAHYPHCDYELQLCDSLGIVVQTEIPWVNVCGKNAHSVYFDVIHQQMKEMICNQYNHASIVFWGMWNELDSWGNNNRLQGPMDAAKVRDETNRLYKYAKSLDPYRYTGLTDCSLFTKKEYQEMVCDYYSENRYNGWYYKVGDPQQFTKDMTTIHDLMGTCNVAEYGAGCDPFCHTTRTDVKYLRNRNDKCHFEEYANLIHESHVRQIKAMPFLNFTSGWILFDFPVANRQEGYYDSDNGITFTANDKRKYTNDKGIVTRDRQTKKDAYFLYRSLWNKKQTTVYITSRRMKSRPENEAISLKVYSNAPSLTLYQNGEAIETLTSSGETSGVVWTFSPVKFKTSEDTFKVTAPDGTTDEVKWKAIALPDKINTPAD